MKTRRRSGIWLLALGGLGSVATVGFLAAYTNNVRSQVGDRVPVVVLTADMQPYQPVTEQIVEVRRVPARWAPDSRFTSEEQVVELVAAAPLREGSFLQRGMLVYAPEVGPHQRRIALAVNAAPVIAGDVARGDDVVIYGTFTPHDLRKDACLTMLAPWARVDDVVEPDEDGLSSGRATVSVIVHKRYASDLLFAASFSEEISIVALGPGALPTRPRSTNCGPRDPKDAKGKEHREKDRGAGRNADGKRDDRGRRGDKSHHDRRRG